MGLQKWATDYIGQCVGGLPNKLGKISGGVERYLTAVAMFEERMWLREKSRKFRLNGNC